MKFDHEHASVEQNKETKPNIAATIVNEDPKNQNLGLTMLQFQPSLRVEPTDAISTHFFNLNLGIYFTAE